MKASGPQEVTQLLVEWSKGNQKALDDLTRIVYRDLRRLAHSYMRSERSGHVLQTTALVNEAYLRLIHWKNVHWKNRAQFIGMCGRLMRRILVDFARSQNCIKRGKRSTGTPLDDIGEIADRRDADLVAIDDALKSLAEIDARKSKIVELRFFGGFSVEEIAEAMNISSRTVMREWNLARAWLYDELKRK